MTINNIVIHRRSEGIPIEKAPAGKFCEVIEADSDWMIGTICILPWSTNHELVILNHMNCRSFFRRKISTTIT
jgi:hypothetical protein